MSLIYAPKNRTDRIGTFLNALSYERQSRLLSEYIVQRPVSDLMIHGAFIGNNRTLRCCLAVRTQDGYLDVAGRSDPLFAQTLNPSLDVSSMLDSSDLLPNLYSILSKTKIAAHFSDLPDPFLALRLIGTTPKEIYAAAVEVSYALFSLSEILVKLNPLSRQLAEQELFESPYYQIILENVCDIRVKGEKRTAKVEQLYTELT